MIDKAPKQIVINVCWNMAADHDVRIIEIQRHAACASNNRAIADIRGAGKVLARIGLVTAVYSAWLRVTNPTIVALSFLLVYGCARVIIHERALADTVVPGQGRYKVFQYTGLDYGFATGMISIRLKGGVPAAHKFMKSTKLFSLAESLGGVESLISHPATMTHASVPADRRAAIGITDGMVRISAGIEDIDDLKDDLTQALDAV